MGSIFDLVFQEKGDVGRIICAQPDITDDKFAAIKTCEPGEFWGTEWCYINKEQLRKLIATLESIYDYMED